MHRGPRPAVAADRGSFHRQPTTLSQVDVNVETLLQEDGNGTPQISCEVLRTGGIWKLRWMRKVLLPMVAWAVQLVIELLWCS